MFVDSSALYALADTDDEQHTRASRIAHSLRHAELMTTDLVLAETWFLARSRLGRAAALRLWQEVRDGAARIEATTPDDLDRAWVIARTFADQDFSLTDCVSFAVIERLNVRQAFSFDRDFAIFRYGLRRALALEVLGLDNAGGELHAHGPRTPRS